MNHIICYIPNIRRESKGFSIAIPGSDLWQRLSLLTVCNFAGAWLENRIIRGCENAGDNTRRANLSGAKSHE